jgi:hypothetical protein
MQKSTITWTRISLLSFFVWLAGFCLYMVPAFIVAIKMGFELGPKSNDTAAVSKQISQTISGMYASSIWLPIAYLVITAVLIYWQSAKLLRHGGRPSQGIAVCSISVVMGIIGIVMTKGSVFSIIEIPVFIIVAIAGSRIRTTVVS